MLIQITPKMLEWYKNLSFERWVDFLNTHKNTKQLRRLLTMGLVDYTDMEREIADAPEPKVLKAGTEVKARVTQVNTGTSDKNDCQWYMPVFDVPDDPMVLEFNDFFWELDQEKLDAKQFQRALYKFKQFAAAFGIDYSRPFSWEDDLAGKEGWVILGSKKSDEYGDQNSVKKYVAGK